MLFYLITMSLSITAISSAKINQNSRPSQSTSRIWPLHHIHKIVLAPKLCDVVYAHELVNTTGELYQSIKELTSQQQLDVRVLRG
jgi:hypothetical protein